MNSIIEKQDIKKTMAVTAHRTETLLEEPPFIASLFEVGLNANVFDLQPLLLIPASVLHSVFYDEC